MNTSASVKKPIAKYELRDVEQFRRLGADRRGPGAPEGNANRLCHGVYANRFLTDEEAHIFEALIDQFSEDFEFNQSSDLIQIELACIYFMKLGRAMAAGDVDATVKMDSMMRGHLKDLKATKIARGEQASNPQTTPAEWACDLLHRWEEAQKSKRRRKRKDD